MAYGIVLRLTQTGVNLTSLLISDLDVGEGGKKFAGRGGFPRPGSPYIPPLGSGYLDLTFSSTVALSFEEGVIRSFLTQGLITSQFFVGPSFAAAVNAYSGWANYGDLFSQTGLHAIPGGVWTTIPNDGMGQYSDSRFLPVGVTKLYDIPTQNLYLEEVTLGAMVSVRVNVTLTPAINNTNCEVRVLFANPPFPWAVTQRMPPMISGAGIPYQQSANFHFYMAETAYGGSVIQILCSNAVSAFVQGFYITVG